MTGLLSYIIKLTDESTIRRHVDHIKAREAKENEGELTVNANGNNVTSNESENSDSSWDTIDVNPSNEEQPNVLPMINTTPTTEPAIRRSERNRQPVIRYPDQHNKTS